MQFLDQKIKGFKKRMACLSLGIVYGTSRGFHVPSRLWVNNKMREIRFKNSNSDSFKYEFNEICIDDCYGLQILKKMPGKVQVIVDIGANQGLFMLAARKKFPHATIHAYEPNPNIGEILQFNGKELQVRVYDEAVTKEDTMVDLHFEESDLHTTSHVNANGKIKGTALRNVIDRAGGKIDILKMDCEGAEWSLLEDTASWKQIRSITMEYHLWANPKVNKTWLTDRLASLGFKVLQIREITADFGLLLAVRDDI